ncbi:hypothetical protein FRD00_02400 [Persicimonas caeni]|nr:hypothetical protein [Persicimonas caeni]QED30852.1 hypothetical protein FRD00_02400 [Persicimonas caeni]
MMAILLTGAWAHAQVRVINPGQRNAEPGQAEPVDVDDTRPVDPRTGQTVDPNDVFVISPFDSGDRMSATALAEQVQTALDQARERTVKFESAIEKVERQFAEIEPGEQVTVPPEVLGRFEREVDVLGDDFRQVRRGFNRLGLAEEAERTRQVVSSLDILQTRLALLGLEFEKAEGATVPSDLQFDFELLVEALALLKQRRLGLPNFNAGRFADNDRIIRPPEGLDPPRGLIRPPEGLEPPRGLIRPAQGLRPSQRIIRPAEGLRPSRQIIRPPRSVNPATDGE